MSPPLSPFREEFRTSVRSGFSVQPDDAESPDRFRAILLEEWYRFPLSGATDILGSNGICNAESTDFPTYHTRTDVEWTGLAETELNDVRNAKELLTIGIILDIVKARGGFLVVSTAKVRPGDTGERLLPLSLNGSAQYIALRKRDVKEMPIGSLVDVLHNQIMEHRKDTATKNADGDQAFIRELDYKLINGAGAGVKDWDLNDAAQLIQQFCASHPGLDNAYLAVFKPDDSTISRLTKIKGASRPNGGYFDEDGLYCDQCGGLIGRDLAEAAKNGWRCYIDPKHYFGVR
jgi:hypothetical protein